MHSLGEIGTTALLQRVPLLSTLASNERLLLARRDQSRSYPGRQPVVWEAESGGSPFVVLSGYSKARIAN